MPPVLKEARQGELHFEVTDTSPLAAQAKASQAAGGLRTLDIANQIANYVGRYLRLRLFRLRSHDPGYLGHE